MALNDYLSDIGNRLKNNLINISEYIITKQLTKPPKDYNKFDSLPHVAVADRLIRTGKKAETSLVGHFVVYVICLPTDGAATNTLASKAFSPDELLHSKGTLKIDVDWYTS
jgi:DNA polymerase alpha subunit A